MFGKGLATIENKLSGQGLGTTGNPKCDQGYGTRGNANVCLGLRYLALTFYCVY